MLLTLGRRQLTMLSWRNRWNLEEMKNHLKFGKQVRERREHEAFERQNNQEVRRSCVTLFHVLLLR